MSSKNYYVNGNTVRELDTPVRHNQRTRKEIEEARPVSYTHLTLPTILRV